MSISKLVRKLAFLVTVGAMSFDDVLETFPDYADLVADRIHPLS